MCLYRLLLRICHRLRQRDSSYTLTNINQGYDTMYRKRIALAQQTCVPGLPSIVSTHSVHPCTQLLIRHALVSYHSEIIVTYTLKIFPFYCNISYRFSIRTILFFFIQFYLQSNENISAQLLQLTTLAMFRLKVVSYVTDIFSKILQFTIFFFRAKETFSIYFFFLQSLLFSIVGQIRLYYTIRLFSKLYSSGSILVYLRVFRKDTIV